MTEAQKSLLLDLRDSQDPWASIGRHRQGTIEACHARDWITVFPICITDKGEQALEAVQS
ncbi:MAG: hypothetical protein ACK5X3_11830 [Pseudomonadota bacterium]